MLGINDWDFLYHLINNNSSMYGSKRETQKQTGKRSNFMKNIEHFIGNFIYYMRIALCCVVFVLILNFHWHFPQRNVNLSLNMPYQIKQNGYNERKTPTECIVFDRCELNNRVWKAIENGSFGKYLICANCLHSM